MLGTILQILFIPLFAFIFLAYLNLSRFIWTPLVLIALISFTFFKLISWPILIIFWVLFIGICVLLHVEPIRHRLISKPIFNLFQRLMPTISDTEREALEAGDIWWESDLLSGTPDWKKLLSYAKPALTPEEESFLNHETEILCQMLDDWRIVQKDHDLPKKVWDYIKQEKFWALQIPKQYGGLGFSALLHSAVVAKIASRSPSAAVNVMVPNSLGPAELLLYYGTEKQKQQYLPALARGDEIPCFGLTGLDAGSDAASMTDTGVICKGEFEGEEIIGMRLNWEKRYITLAPIATLLGLAVKVSDPDHLLGKKEDLGITLCLIPTSHPGIEIGGRHFPLQMAFMNGPTRGKDVFIPLDWVIGGKEKIGHGWRMLMECLSIGRSISLPALSCASSMLAYRTTGAYARVRKQFRLPIGKFEGVEEALARIAGFTYQLEACRTLTAGAVNQHIKPAVASAIAKYHMTEISRRVIDDAMDVHGGRAIQLGPRNYLAHAYISLPIGITVEGANILTRNLMIFGQGAVRCHPYLRAEIATLSHPDAAQSLKTFDQLFLKHMGHAFNVLARTFVMGLTNSCFVWTNNIADHQKKYVRQLTRMSSALALTTEMTFMLLGGNLKRKERLSARLGDVLSHLYLASSILKYDADQNFPEEDRNYIAWSMQHNLHQIQNAFYGFFKNFPNRIVSGLMQFFIFPWGRSYCPPSDKLDHELAQSMMMPSALRTRLTHLVFANKDENDPIGKMDNALHQIIIADEAQQKLKQALQNGEVPQQKSMEKQLKLASESGLLTPAEIEALQHIDVIVRDAVMVDEFEKL